jgi:hypothetical protein
VKKNKSIAVLKPIPKNNLSENFINDSMRIYNTGKKKSLKIDQKEI